MVLFKRKQRNRNSRQGDRQSVGETDLPDFVDRKTGRHRLDALYERFSKPQIQAIFAAHEPSIYIRHHEGQKIEGNYQIERVFDDGKTGFYAEGRIPLSGNAPPVLVIRGYGSWYPLDGVLQDTPDVFLADFEWQLKAAEKQGALDWLKEKCDRGDFPDAIGESLGGKIAQQLAAKYPDCIRSTVTFNALGVSEKIAETSEAKWVFHYFTLGERYAFWANGGHYIPGKFLQISPGGRNWNYKLGEWILKLAPSPIKHFKSRNWFMRVLEIGLRLIAQWILFDRHNGLILNRKRPVVVEVELQELLP